MKNTFAMAVAFAVLAASAGAVAQSKDDTGLEHLVIEMATTSAQHHAVAEHYRAQAEAARQEMRRHERMADAYMRGRPQPQMRDHCKKIAENYGKNATEYDELAKLHDEQATHAPK